MSEQNVGGTAGCVVMVGFILLIGSCAFSGSDDAEPEQAPRHVAAPAIRALTVAPIAIRDSDPAASRYPVQACKAAMALMNGHDVSIMRGRTLSRGLVHVSWRRPDDGKRWQAHCEVIDDSHIRWAAYDAFGDGQQGRWRNEDSITVTSSEGELNIDLGQYMMARQHRAFALSDL